MPNTPILVLEAQGDTNVLRVLELNEENVEGELNGESVYHVIHVRMITDLLLRELCQAHPELIPEEDIDSIATASTLHDIGKRQIPAGILNHPGTLSPVEYDIVKKHAPFGEDMIRHAKAVGVDEKTVEYAAQIAKNHHERVDGTGYPDGLRSNQIPVCSQIVALADSYDALTSNRSYKDAFSQDVALQMIASGMCGTFEGRLVECLMKVVNHRTLVEFRENMLKNRAVVEEYTSVIMKRILFIGNTEYLTEQFVTSTFPQSKVMVVGNSQLGNADKIKLFRVRKPSIKAVLETYAFDLIVFFAAGLRFQTTDHNDSEELREVLQYSAQLQRNAKLIYLSPLDAAFQSKTDKGIMAAANESLCKFYAKGSTLDIKTVQIPYLYSATNKKDFLYGVFEELFQNKTVNIPEAATSKMHFLSLDDLSHLLQRMVDNWKVGSGILSVKDEFDLTFSDFASALTTLCPDAKVNFTQTLNSGILKTNNSALRSEYGWFAKISILEELPEQYEKFLIEKQNASPSLWDRIRKRISEHSALIKTLELFLLFLLSELLIQLTDSAIIFSIVDFRTIYIVIMATMYGLAYGMGAASLSSISYFLAKVASGTSPLTLFYEPTNWLAFVFFYLVGGLCGYVNRKKEDENRFLSEQNRLLENKLVFTSEIYEDTLRDKKELKKQIISSKDSFGKIFDITRKLNTVAPQQLYLRMIETFEEVLENKSIAVYSLRPASPFGRLEVASRDLLEVATRSVSLDVYAPVIEQLKDGGIWKNTSLNQDLPMYASGVYRGEDLILMIFLWHANADQKSLYYVNLFKILRDLVQMSLIRAYDYSIATMEKQYIGDTRIMNADFFRECKKNFAALAEKKISSSVLLEFDLQGLTPEEADRLLDGKVRTNDVLGLSSEGTLQLILSQATVKDLDFILPRFEKVGLPIKVVK